MEALSRHAFNALILALMLALLLPALYAGLTRRIKNHADRVLVLWAAVCLFILFYGTQRLLYSTNPHWLTIQQETDHFRSTLVQRSHMGRLLSIDAQPLAETDVDGQDRPSRSYPSGEVAAPVTGFLICGEYAFTEPYAEGLEKAYLPELAGLNRTGDSWSDSLLYPLGRDVQTTIDSRLQSLAFSLLDSLTGAAIILDVHTGAVRALASAPSYDPATLYGEPFDFDKAVNKKGFKHYGTNALASLFPLGSGIEILDAAASARLDSCNSDFDYLRDRFLKSRVLTRASRSARWIWGWGTARPIAQSLRYHSRWFTRTASRFSSSVAATALSFGFNDTLEWNSEREMPLPIAPSTFPPGDDPLALNQASGTSAASPPILVTPLHLCLMAAAVANNGAMVRPRLIVDSSIPDRIWKHAMTPDASAVVRKLFAVSIASDSGAEGGPGIPYAALSATTEWRPTRHLRTYSWCIAYAPSDSPSLAFALCIEQEGRQTTETVSRIERLILMAGKCGYFSNDRLASH